MKILQNILDLTHSDMGHIRMIDFQGKGKDVLYSIGHSSNYKSIIRPLSDSYSKKVLRLKKYIKLQSITDVLIQNKLGTYFPEYQPVPRAAVFYPVKNNNEIFAIITIFSKYPYSYSKQDLRKLRNFSPQILQVHNITKLFQEITKIKTDQENQLKFLNKLVEFLENQKDYITILQETAVLLLEILKCEEVSIFMVDEVKNEILNKKVVASTSRESNRLGSIERSYKVGKSPIGKCFIDQKELFVEGVLIDSLPKNLKNYGSLLVSGKINNLFCFPISIGETPLGVIRIINQRILEEQNDSDSSMVKEINISLLNVIANHLGLFKLVQDYKINSSYLELLFQNSPNPIIAINPKGKITRFNNACEKIWGFKKENVLGDSAHKYYESYDQAKKIENLLEANQTIIEEVKIKDKKGKIIPIQLSAATLKDENGNKIGSIGILKDIREQKKNEIKLLENEKLAAIGKLMQSFGHEIKTKFGVVQNFIKTINIDSQNQDSQRLRQIALDTSQEAVRKIQQILDAVKPRETRLINIKLAELFSNSIFTKMKERFLLQTSANNSSFNLCLELREGFQISVDLDQINQIFENLFSNSLSAIEETAKIKKDKQIDFNGSIKLNAFNDSKFLYLEWEDNGSGIPKDNIPNIFNPFFSTKPTGNGLGLFAVKSIIEKHQGVIDLISTEIQGTKFLIKIPLIKYEDSPISN